MLKNKGKFNQFIIVSILFVANITINAQDLENNPTSLKWQQLKSDHFKIIYPKGLDSIANRTINVMETNYLGISNSLGKQPRPISVLIQNQNNISNGFVSYTPRRSEFFITSPQDYTLLGTYNWMDQLAKHEFRHVVQFEKAFTGITKLLYPFIGNYGMSGLSHLVVPSWFWEGDAVGIETSHSHSGRGAIPSFSMLMRSQLADYNQPFTYSKAVGRSYKHNIPNQYVLGYYLSSFLKENKGYDIWDKVLESTYKFPLYPFSFSNNVKKATGKNIDQLYKSAFLDLQNKAKTQLENRISYEKNHVYNSKSKYYTDYEYPQFLSGGKILALKSGLAEIAQFVIFDQNSKQRSIHKLGAFNDGFTISSANEKVVWAEFMPDARWQMRNYSNLKILDISNGTVKQITKKTRLASPSLKPDGRQIVAVNTSELGAYNLQLLNSESGNVFKEFTNHEHVFYQHPSWSADGKSIAVIALLNNEKTIQVIDIETGKYKNILPYSNNNLAHPILKGNLLLYNNAQNGVDNVFLLNIETGQNYQVTNAKFGAFNGVLSPDNKEILFTEFTCLGHRPVKMNFDIEKCIPIEYKTNLNPSYFGKWMVDEANKNFIEKPTDKKYVTTNYSKWNVLNLNSWGFVANSTGNSIAVGVDTQDLLSTLTTSLGVGYNPTERQSNYFANISYQGFYPIFELGFINDGRQTFIPKGSIKDQNTDLRDNWRQQAVSVGVRIPFNFQNGKFYSKLNVGSSFSHIEGQDYDLTNRYTTQIGSKSLQSVTNYVNFSRKIKNAKRNLGPRWEQNFYIYSRNTPFKRNLQSKLFALQGSVVIPGIGKHDNLRLRANYLMNGKDNSYFYSSPVAFPRGHDYSIFDKITTTSVDYRFPIADPDLELGRFLYIQRLKGNIFGDFGYGYYVDDKNLNRKQGYNTIGADISAIFNIMRFSTPIEIGVRFNYFPKPLPGQNNYQIVPLIIDIPF